jgi:hypothetical protein
LFLTAVLGCFLSLLHIPQGCFPTSLHFCRDQPIGGIDLFELALRERRLIP